MHRIHLNTTADKSHYVVHNSENRWKAKQKLGFNTNRQLKLSQYCTFTSTNSLYISLRANVRKQLKCVSHFAQTPISPRYWLEFKSKRIKGIYYKSVRQERKELEVIEIKFCISEEVRPSDSDRPLCLLYNTERIATQLIFYSNNNDLSFALSSPRSPFNRRLKNNMFNIQTESVLIVNISNCDPFTYGYFQFRWILMWLSQSCSLIYCPN